MQTRPHAETRCVFLPAERCEHVREPLSGRGSPQERPQDTAVVGGSERMREEKEPSCALITNGTNKKALTDRTSMLQPRKTTRANYRMVAENDPQWMRFWDAYPYRVSKKEARKAWADLDPHPELVDRMLVALAWQGPLWAKQGYGTPYPASWIRAERWTDEMPAQAFRLMSDAAAMVFKTRGVKL